MTSIDICKIIEACGKYGAKSIKLHGIMDLTFNGYVDEILYNTQETLANKVHSVDNKDNEFKEEQLDLEELLISDPVAYEQTMNGGINDA